MEPTRQQRQAIEATGRSVIVTAAAGSGKTAVIAQRCAYLVCDAPPPYRCDVDQLLVLTFTDAAAAEMRSRIVAAIRARLEADPGNARLREQVVLADAARISTIHAFCFWLVRRWFNEADIDPACVLLDDQEGPLLRSEVLDRVFQELYEGTSDPDRPLGKAAGDEPSREVDGPGSLGAAFARLVDVYGLGEDRQVAKFVLDVHEFTTSLPDPETWLTRTAHAARDEPDRVILDLLTTLRQELEWQAAHCLRACDTLGVGHDAIAFCHERITEYAAQLDRWRSDLAPLDDSEGDTAARLELLARVCHDIHGWAFSSGRSPSVRKDTPEEVRRKVESARGALKDVKETLFKKRLYERYTRFTLDEWRDGLRRTAPFVATVVELVRRFAAAYADRKRALNVLDFSDLERAAFNLLHDPGGLSSPSDIARVLHDKFAHVLVDEFQDINPLQRAVLQLVSHEARSDRKGNLFVVGDVKQSIYRFRLAEPDLFLDRLRNFREGDGGEAISLQKNFRSRAHLLDAINAIFGVLMLPGSGAIEYDEEAVLHAGRDEPQTPPAPVEVHVLERRWRDDETVKEDAEDDDTQDTPPEAEGERRPLVADDPAGWSSIEREAHVIGLRIRAWMASGDRLENDKPLEYRDIAVLLRAAKVNAEHIAAMLAAMDIPAFAAVGGSLFAAVEVRDVLSALNVLDNAQQDIPLVGVMRSGVLGHQFTEDDLLRIRLLDRHDDYHRVVRRYETEGDDVSLRDRVGAFLTRLERLRLEGQRRPPAELIAKIYHEFGHLAYCCALPDGAQRRANLFKLQELARKFGTFRRQGLQRFLRFVDGMSEEEQNVALASAIGESENVVRIMSVHHSKGLEFPAVFLAGLGNRFNLGDRSGRMIRERGAGIGLRVVDTERMIEYPSAAYLRVVDEVERQTRAEELRILYVAMTRARDRLVLVGSRVNAAQAVADMGVAGASPPSAYAVGTAATPFDWLIPAVGHAGSLFDVRLHTPETMSGWRLSAAKDDRNEAVRRAAAALERLPASEPVATDDALVESVQARLDFVYPYLSTASVRATVAASEHKGLYDFTGSAESPWVAGDVEPFAIPASKYVSAGVETAADRGIVTHRVLQHLDFDVATGAEGVASELQRMVSGGVIRGEDRAALDEEALAWFAGTPLAEAIRRAGGGYLREFQYITAESPEYFDASVHAADDDFVLVRGVVDGILPVDEGIEVIDFKTDGISADEVARRVERYRPQMELYARAVTRMRKTPVTTCRLVFLTPRVIEVVTVT